MCSSDLSGLTTAAISEHTGRLQAQLADALDRTAFGDAELLNPLDGRPHGRFLAFRSQQAKQWYADLKARNCISDVRGDVLRIGFGLYQDDTDVDRFIALMERS